jgi:hypothetical protein
MERRNDIKFEFIRNKLVPTSLVFPPDGSQTHGKVLRVEGCEMMVTGLLGVPGKRKNLSRYFVRAELSY